MIPSLFMREEDGQLFKESGLLVCEMGRWGA